MKLRKFIIIVLSIVSSAQLIDARSRRAKTIKSERSFDKYARRGLTAVLFYKQGKRPRRKEEMARAQWEKLNDKNDNLIAMFSAASKNFLYEEGDLDFAVVNVARRDELAQIARQYGVATFPTIVLLNFGNQIQSKLGASAKLSGYVTQSQLNRFIKNSIGQKLEKRKKQKAEYRKKRLEQARIRAYYAPYYSPYWGYGWGYPYWGFGWGYPYYGRWWW